MKKISMRISISIFLLLLTISGKSQTLFSNAFGDPKNPVIVFIHGGPGYNAVSFELGAAVNLAGLGYYVITFDQRGSGRSKKDSITDHYKFNKADVDINTILKKYNVTQAVFIGHGWGGTEAIKYAESYPEKVKGIVLLSSPLNYQLMFKSIIQHCREKFKNKKDTMQLRLLSNVQKIDTTRLDYSSNCFMFAMNNSLYTPLKPGAEREHIYEEIKENKKAIYLSNMTVEPVYGFYMNEQYTTLDMQYDLRKVQEKNIPVYAIYGKEDGLFNQVHLDMIKKSVGDANFVLIENSSHNIFIDQREEFLKQVKKFLSPPSVEKARK
jgi:proline iminopeptidase